MSTDTSINTTDNNRRKRPPKTLNVATHLRTVREIGLALLTFTIILSLIWQGALAMEYNWQWYRVSPFFYRIIDGEFIFGPLYWGLMETLKLASVAGIIAIIIGFITAFARMSNSRAGSTIATFYLEAIRNTPLIVQLFLFYFVLAPIFGIDRFWSGVLCLAFFEGSFAAEIIRGGIQGVDRGQFEASDATGLTTYNKYRYIIVPQSMPLILPPLTGLLISLIKHSAIVSVIAVSELTTTGLNLISDTFMAFEIWFIIAGIYLTLTISLSIGVGQLEKKLNVARSSNRS
ncbi:MAG: polar amino acid transport system permease protein [Candidatus Azotimanducaceae bacterium]|jgi:polar amino acid transport system permease protein